MRINTHRIDLEQKCQNDYQINIHPIGMGLKTISSFWVLNPTNKTYFWKMTQKEVLTDGCVPCGLAVQVIYDYFTHMLAGSLCQDQRL